MGAELIPESLIESIAHIRVQEVDYDVVLINRSSFQLKLTWMYSLVLRSICIDNNIIVSSPLASVLRLQSDGRITCLQALNAQVKIVYFHRFNPQNLNTDTARLTLGDFSG